MADVLPLRLWAYCAKIHPVDGRLKGYSAVEVEGAIGWTGDPNKAVEAMGRAGFILKTAGGFQCVDWKQHEGHLAAFSRRGKIANQIRWGRYKQGILQGIPKSQSRNPPSLPNQPNLPDQKKEKAPPQAPRTFTPPSLAEVQAYCQERGKGVNAQRFVDFYASKGWMVGKNRMKDWKAAMRGQWEDGPIIPATVTKPAPSNPNPSICERCNDEPATARDPSGVWLGRACQVVAA